MIESSIAVRASDQERKYCSIRRAASPACAPACGDAGPGARADSVTLNPVSTKRLVNPLPFQRLDRRLALPQRRLRIARRLAERRLDIIRVRRLGQIMAGAQLDRLHRGGNAGEAGQHHDQHGRVMRVQRLHARQARPGGEFQIDHGVMRRPGFQQRGDVLQPASQQHLIAPALERPAQGRRETGIVLDQQQQTLRRHRQPPLRSAATPAAGSGSPSRRLPDGCAR